MTAKFTIRQVKRWAEGMISGHGLRAWLWALTFLCSSALNDMVFHRYVFLLNHTQVLR